MTDMKKILLILLSLAVVYSCTKSPKMAAPYLEVSQDYVVVPSFSTACQIALESNTQWKLTVSEGWVDANVTSGVGDATLSFTMHDNIGERRTCQIKLHDIRSLVTKDICIEQNGVKGAEYVSVATLRAMAPSSGSYSLTEGRLSAIVLTDYSSSNYPDGMMAVGDSFTDSRSGINVKTPDGYVAFRQGCELEMELAGATLSRQGGVLTLALSSAPRQTLTSTVSIVPCDVTYEKLLSGNYESMFVRVSNYQVAEAFIGGSFVRCPLFENEKGEHVRLSVREDASFSASLYNRGKGNICGIAAPAEAGIPVLLPTKDADADLSRLRFGIPGVEELPYVFSFLTYQDMDACPKYLKYYEQQYNPSTKLVQGLVAKDEDESVAATLELTCYGLDESKIANQRTSYWSEAAGHDNINCSGFVSQNNGTVTPTAECGWWWSVPLRMTLPPRINVSFGLAGANYALREWRLYWSKDKKNWNFVQSVNIMLSRNDGPYYLYYTVPVTLTEAFNSGDVLYVKLTPYGDRAIIGSTGQNGHGASCVVNLHSAIVISEETEQRTKAPSGAFYFQPFDKLTAGMDYFYGEKLAAMLNFSGNEYSAWPPRKKGLLDADTKDVYERPGYAQIGFVNEERGGSRSEYKNYPGSLVLPPLGEGGDFTLTFKAARYRNACVDRIGNRGSVPDIVHPDISKGVVRLLPEDTEATFVETHSSIAQFSGMPYDKFRTYTLTVKDATPQTRIVFTSVPQSSEDMTRWFIDDITLYKNN